jgi:hypothetical protein
MTKIIAYGVTIQSEIDLPGLETSQDTPEVIVRLGRVEKPPCSPDAQRAHFIDRQEMRVFWQGVGTFLVRLGREVIIQPEPATEDDVVRLFLLGPVLSILLNQRGFLVLHASVVKVGSAAVGFLGEKGWGKSTTAATLNARGHALVADDILAVLPGTLDAPMVQPGLPHFKLWPEAAAASFGDDPNTLARLHSKVEKRIRVANRGVGRKPIPLSRIYVLDRGETLESIPMTPSRSLMALVQHTFLSKIIRPMGESGDNFRQCSRLVQSVPIHRLQRPMNLNGLGEIARLVETEAGWDAPAIPMNTAMCR